jgi:hypothetical protein
MLSSEESDPAVGPADGSEFVGATGEALGAGSGAAASRAQPPRAIAALSTAIAARARGVRVT